MRRATLEGEILAQALRLVAEPTDQLRNCAGKLCYCKHVTLQWCTRQHQAFAIPPPALLLAQADSQHSLPCRSCRDAAIGLPNQAPFSLSRRYLTPLPPCAHLKAAGRPKGKHTKTTKEKKDEGRKQAFPCVGTPSILE